MYLLQVIQRGCLVVMLLVSSATVAQDFSDSALRAADPVSGEQTYQQYCAFCHTLRSGEADISGPNLHNFFARGIGGKEGFAYSDAMLNANDQWTPEKLAAYVQNPGAEIPGNRMPAVAIPEDKVVPLVAFLMRATGAVSWDEPTVAAAQGGRDAELKSGKPEFWSQYMNNTVRFKVLSPGPEQADYSFVAYFNDDGTVSGNNRGLKGIWRMQDKRTFCYAIQGIAVAPYEWVDCFKPAANESLVWGEVIDTFEPVQNARVEVSWLESRPHPLEGDAHPNYWVFLFNNTSRYEIKVDGETQIVDAHFNPDKTISSPQGVTGEWRTEGSDGKDDRMCYRMTGVPGIEGDLTECFALVLMFNPRVGARWPARFDQGNTYWAEIIAGR